MSDKEKKVIFEKDEDTPMGYRIARKDTKQVNHKSKFLKPNSNFILVCGSTGTGKSTALLTIIPMFTNKTKYIIIASKKVEDDAHDAIKEYCEKENINYKYVHDIEECADTLADILDKKKKDEHMIVVFDDFNTQYSSRSEEGHNNIMIKCFAMLRSSNCSAIAITQSYSNLPTKLRENANMRVVFALGNIYSVRALLDDTVGLFFDGDDEKSIRSDIKKIYKQVHLQPHQFIVITNGPPSPQIRIGWNKIVYPSDQAGEIAGGSIPTVRKKHHDGKGILLKHQLWAQARDLGIPSYLHHTANVKQLQEFIKLKTAEGQKGIGNSAPEIQKVLEDSEPPEGKLKQRLHYNIRRYKSTGNPRNLNIIAELCNKIVDTGVMDITQVKYYLKRAGLEDEIEF